MLHFCVAFGVAFGVWYVWCLVRGMCVVVWRAENLPCFHHVFFSVPQNTTSNTHTNHTQHNTTSHRDRDKENTKNEDSEREGKRE